MGTIIYAIVLLFKYPRASFPVELLNGALGKIGNIIMSRGIVVGSRISADYKTINGSFEREDVLRWLLYWDNISYAGVGSNGGSISGNHSEDIKYLETLGVFNTEIIELSSLGELTLPPADPELGSTLGFTHNQYPVVEMALRIKLRKKLSQRTDDIWCVGQSGGEKLILPNPDKSKELIDVQLNKCLPVPTQDTPFEDILNFKENYRAELEHLRYALDNLREKILSSNDERRVLDSAMREISISLENLSHAMNGKGIKTLTETVSLYTNNPSLSFWAALGGIVGGSKGIPIEVSASAGLAIPTAFTFIKRNVLGGDSLPSPESDFTYAFKIKNEFK